MQEVDYTRPVGGRELFEAIRGKDISLIAANTRTMASVEGVILAAMKTNSAVIFELSMRETRSCDLSPSEFVAMITSEAKRLGFNQPHAIHGDHIQVRDTSDEAFGVARELLEAQIAAGFTSFAIDASPTYDLNAETTEEALRHNIDITTRLARIIGEKAPNASIEVEVGEIGHKGTDGQQLLTTVEEAVTFVKALRANGIRPDILTIHNGSEHGTSFDLDGRIIPQKIDLDRTKEVADAVAEEDLVGIAQHGTTGTTMENLEEFHTAGICKVNIATHFQDIVRDNLPADLRKTIDEWCLESEELQEVRAAIEKKLSPDMDNANRDEVIIRSLWTHANGKFKDALNNLDEETRKQITEQTMADTIGFINRFNSNGSGHLVSDYINQMNSKLVVAGVIPTDHVVNMGNTPLIRDGVNITVEPPHNRVGGVGNVCESGVKLFKNVFVTVMVADDDIGHGVRSFLDGTGVDTTGVVVKENVVDPDTQVSFLGTDGKLVTCFAGDLGSAASTIIVESPTRTIAHHPGTNPIFSPSHVPAEVMKGADAFVLFYLGRLKEWSGKSMEFFDAARERGTLTLAATNGATGQPEEILKQMRYDAGGLDILVTNMQEGAAIIGRKGENLPAHEIAEAAMKIMQEGSGNRSRLVAVTQGSEGSYLLYVGANGKKSKVHINAPPVERKQPIGTGDNFALGMTFYAVRNRQAFYDGSFDLKTAGEVASTMAGLHLSQQPLENGNALIREAQRMYPPTALKLMNLPAPCREDTALPRKRRTTLQ